MGTLTRLVATVFPPTVVALAAWLTVDAAFDAARTRRKIGELEGLAKESRDVFAGGDSRAVEFLDSVQRRLEARRAELDVRAPEVRLIGGGLLTLVATGACLLRWRRFRREPRPSGPSNRRTDPAPLP